MVQSKNWCFTAFNNIEQYEDINNIIRRDTKQLIKYIVYQGEYTKETKKHIQGFIQFHSKKRMEQIKKLLDDKTAHLEVMKGTPEQAREYCIKTEKDGIKQEIFLEPKQYGDFDNTTERQRTDLIDIKNRLINGETLNNIMLDTQDEKTLRNCVQYNKTLRELQHTIQQKTQRELILEKYENTIWNIKQKTIINIIDNELEQENTRRINWVYDEHGNTGKTYLARYYVAQGNTYYITGGRQADILYSYEGQPIIIYDLARTYADNIEHIYTTFENLKNGFYLSTKYNTEQRIYSKQPIIIVLSNFKPDINKLSKDRWNIIDLEEIEDISSVNETEIIIPELKAIKKRLQ